jgi:nucleoporin p58/p45
LTAQPQQASGGLFGSTPASQPAQSGGLFGSTPASQPASGSLFGATPASQPASGGLFGAAPPSQPASGGLFGSTPAATTAQSSGGLFGFNNTSQPAKPAGGLLGAAPIASSQPSGSIFGNAAASGQPSLFASTASAAPAAGNTFGQSTGGIFGASQTASQPSAQTANIFNTAQAASTQQTRPSLFTPAPAAARPPTLFGSSTTNNTNQGTSQQQTVPGIKIDLSNIKPTTRMFELHEDIQNMILHIDGLIQGGINASMQCSQVLPKLGEAVEQLPLDVSYLEDKIEIVEGALGRDAVDVGTCRSIVRADADDAMTVFKAVENLKLPSLFHYGGATPNLQTGDARDVRSPGEDSAASTDLLSYFNTQSTAIDYRLNTFTQQLFEVEQHLRTVESTAVEGIEQLIRKRNVADASSDSSGVVDTGEGVRELVGAMRGFEDAVLRVAGRVGGAREGVVDLSLGLRA